jgi:hypothetical protein
MNRELSHRLAVEAYKRTNKQGLFSQARKRMVMFTQRSNLTMNGFDRFYQVEEKRKKRSKGYTTSRKNLNLPGHRPVSSSLLLEPSGLHQLCASNRVPLPIRFIS